MNTQNPIITHSAKIPISPRASKHLLSEFSTPEPEASRPPRAPHRRYVWKGAAVPPHCSTISDIHPSRGRGGARPLLYSLFGYVVVFQIFMFHVKQLFIFIFFLCVISRKRVCCCTVKAFAIVNQQFTSALFQHFSVQKYSSTNFRPQSTLSALFLRLKVLY